MATETGRRARLDPEVFRLPVERIRAGYYSDAYFNFTASCSRSSTPTRA